MPDTVITGTCGEDTSIYLDDWCHPPGGDSVRWEFDEAAGTMTISGSGAMADYYGWRLPEFPNRPPWYELREKILSLRVEDGVTEIGENTFSGCVNLRTISLAPSVKHIRGVAFRGCRSLQGLRLPDTVRSISPSVFSGCTGITEFTTPPDQIMIGANAFEYSGLRRLTISDKVDYIQKEAFLGCAALEEISLPAGVRLISSKAFAGCDALRTVRFRGTWEQWQAARIESGNEALERARLIFER